jgi:hypothetical protein
MQGQTAPAATALRFDIRTFLPYCANRNSATLAAVTDHECASMKGVPMFLFSRPLIAPLAGLAAVGLLLMLDTYFNLSAILKALGNLGDFYL